jgi:hypothetical protein
MKLLKTVYEIRNIPTTIVSYKSGNSIIRTLALALIIDNDFRYVRVLKKGNRNMSYRDIPFNAILNNNQFNQMFLEM